MSTTTQRIIIIEGHDTSGKTHIASALSKELNIPVFKASRDKHWWDPMVNLLYFSEGISQFIEQTGTSVILDRWMPSDYMYSKLFNRDISYHKIWELDHRFAKLNTLLIVCYKDAEKYIDDKVDFEFVDKTMYSKMTDLYHQYVETTQLRHVLILNTSSEDIETQLYTITNYLKDNGL